MKKLFFLMILDLFVTHQVLAASQNYLSLELQRLVGENGSMLIFSAVFVLAASILFLMALFITWNRAGVRIGAVALAFFVFTILNPSVLHFSSLQIGMISVFVTLPLFVISFLFPKKELKEKKDELQKEGYDVEHPVRIHNEWDGKKLYVLYNSKTDRRVVVNEKYKIIDCDWKA